MSLSDCLKRIPMDAEDVAEINRLVAENGGDEVAAVQTFIDGLNSDLDEARADLIVQGFDVAFDRDAAAPATGSPDRIEDFGETLAGARKHTAEKFSDRLEEIADDQIGSVALSKSWPDPSYQKMIEDGVSPDAVAMVRAMRDNVPSKPRASWKLKRWVEQVREMREAAKSVVAGETDANTAAATLRSGMSKTLARYVENLAALYEAVGHDVSLKGHRLTVAEYSMYRGEEFSPPKRIWEVTKGSARSNWPTRIVATDSRAEAIEKFKAHLEANGTSGGKAKSPTKFDLWWSQDRTSVIVGKKVGRGAYITLADGFEDARAARAYVAENQETLEADLAVKRQIPSERRAENSTRVGVDHRNGQDVTPDMFSETFGFRGVQFGNYVEGRRRQADLNEAYDGLMDLAGVLNVPPASLSLNGSMGLAFGARGTGGRNAAAAHFEPGNIVINLTKGGGAGSLAHEWWHGIDNYFSRERGDAVEYLSEGTARDREGVRPEVVNAVAEINAAIRGTGLPKRSRETDKRRSQPYFGTGREMTARTFEQYVITKLADADASNDYLANIVSEEVWNVAYGGSDAPTYPYLRKDEIPAVQEAYDNLFDVIETQETERGVAFFSMDGGLLSTSDLTFIEAAKAEGLTDPAEVRARAVLIAKDAGFWEAGGEVVSDGELDLDGVTVRYRTTEGAAEKVADLQVAMAHQLRKVGLPEIKVFVPEEMRAKTPTGDSLGVGGFFSRDVIGIALRQKSDPMFTLNHEVLHVLRSSDTWGGRPYGLFTETEWRALERQALKVPNSVKEAKIKLYGGFGRETVIEEIIADMAANYLTGGRSVTGFAGRALRKISQFFEALGNALRGLGFTTADQVFERVDIGEVAARAEGMSASSDVRFSLGPVKKRQSPQHAAHKATRMGGTPFVPDRRIWEELGDASQGYWGRLRGAQGAVMDKVDAARIRIQDRFLPVLRAQEAVQMAAGQPLPPEQDAYVAETTFSGKVGRHLFEIDEEFTKPIIDLIGQSKGELTVDTVGEWLTARHAIERNAYIAKINPKMPDGGSGMDTATARDILQSAESGPHTDKLEAIADKIDELRDRTLKLREDAGLITAEEATIWRNQYDSYVPLKGFAETDHSEGYLDATGAGRRFNTRGAETRRALGRQSEAFNPLQAAITQAQEVAIRAEKNRVGQALFELVSNNQAPDMWEVKKPAQKQVFNSTTGLVETRTEDPVGLFMDANEMAVKIDGEEQRITFKDPRLARAAGSVGADQMGWFIQIMSMAARYFSAVNTMMDPEFVIRNAFRDMTSAQVNIRNFGSDARNRIAKDMVKNWPRAFAGAYRGQKGLNDTKWSQYFKEFEEAGAKVSFWVLDQPEAGKADLEKRIRLAAGSRLQRASKFAKFSTRDNPVLGFIERTNLAVDNAVRLAAFVSARDAGWEVQDAAALSKNLTVNFNRRGEWGATINALYPFANAGIQGTQILVRAMTKRRMIKYMVGMIALGAILDQVNAGWSEEDEDGELAYDKIPDWKNQMNLVVMLGPESGNAATVWLPYGYNIFPYLGQQASKVARGVKDPSDAMGDLALAAFSAFSPLGGGNLQSIVTPTMLDPINEMSQNQDWLGRPIRPESPYADYGPDAYKFYRGASTTARVTADTLNKATGGTIAESGLIDVSPEYIDHAAAFAFGGVGRFLGRTVDLAGNLVTGQVAEIEDRDIPFYRSLQTTTGDWLDSNRYYAFRERVREGSEAAETYRENNLPIPDHIARLAKLEDAVKAVEKELRKTRKQKRAIDADEEMSLADKAAKREEIREKDLKEMMPFNKQFIKVMGPQGE